VPPSGALTSDTGETASRVRPNRRHDILDVFTRMVAERGYEAVSLREVADELAISKATIIHHFGTKEQMLQQVHEVYIRERIAEARRIVAAIDAPLDQVVALVLQNFLALRTAYVSTVAFAREIVRFSKDGEMEPVRRLRREYSQILQDALQHGMDDGTFRQRDARLLTLQVFGNFNWVWTWLRVDGSWSVEHIAESFIDTLLGGMLADGTPPPLDAVRPVVFDVMGIEGDRA
jgi:AcrR family transcriptional regulator